eukprot:scaffold149792_cov41-Prasinocladus_malaysianus.AAC.2
MLALGLSTAPRELLATSNQDVASTWAGEWRTQLCSPETIEQGNGAKDVIEWIQATNLAVLVRKVGSREPVSGIKWHANVRV